MPGGAPIPLLAVLHAAETPWVLDMLYSLVLGSRVSYLVETSQVLDAYILTGINVSVSYPVGTSQVLDWRVCQSPHRTVFLRQLIASPIFGPSAPGGLRVPPDPLRQRERAPFAFPPINLPTFPKP